ncbi:MAG: alpha/beta hydrolase [Actinomycetota bacterium]|nr:alpha/beta hydrolase [Actinomycetota bacterium]
MTASPEQVSVEGREGWIFDVRAAGPKTGAPVILLHGFPQDSTCWDQLIGPLTVAGYRTIAPDLRGYSPGSRPSRVDDYALDHLLEDVLDIADDFGSESFHVVGHDWGGVLAWALAVRHADRILSLTSLSMPHPKAFQQALLTPVQAARSLYALFVQIPVVPERLLLARDSYVLRRALQATGLSAERARYYARRMNEPDALSSALAWYRAAMRSPARERGSTVARPTLYLWGTADPALGRRAAETTADHVTGPYRFERLEDAGHWLPETEADRVIGPLLDHLAGAP